MNALYASSPSLFSPLFATHEHSLASKTLALQMYAMNMAGFNNLPNEIMLEALAIALPEGFENCAQRPRIRIRKVIFEAM